MSADPRHVAQIAPAQHEEFDGQLVLSVTDSLRDALASLEPPALPHVARQWASAEFDDTGWDSLTLFLAALAELARRAIVDSHRLYCCITS